MAQASSRLRLATLLILFLLTLAVYLPVLNHHFLHYDDTVYVTENSIVQQGITWDGIQWAFRTWHRSNWLPLTWLSHMVGCSLFGLNPQGHHLINLLLHLLNTLLLYRVLYCTTGAHWRSALVAALFAVHPLHVESVAWISERKDVLSTSFWLLTIGTYARYVRDAEARPISFLRSKRYYGVLALFALGLMAKPMLVTLPLTLLLLDLWPFRRSGWKTVVLEKIPLLLLSLVLSFVTFAAQFQGGAVASLETISWWRRINNAVISYGVYIFRTFVPQDLGIYYPFPSQPYPLWQFFGVLSILIGVSCLVLWKWREQRYLAVGWLWFLGTLVPTIGLIQVGGQARADHYTYVPLIGLFVMITWGAGDGSRRLRLPTGLLVLLGALVLGGYSVLAREQVGYWRDDRTLFQHTVDVTPRSFVAHNNLGNALYLEGRHAEARLHFEQALEIDPSYPNAHNNLGNLHMELGEYEEAAHYYGLTRELAPGQALVEYNLGQALMRLGNTEHAAAHFRIAIELDPSFAPAARALWAIDPATR